jgi:hypothetical protein
LYSERRVAVSGIRYANFGLAVFAAILAIGGFLLRDAGDSAIQALAFVAVVAGAFVYLFTEKRAERRSERNQ